MTILITDKDFADAVKNNERIQNKTIYWIGEEPNFSCLGLAPVAFAQTKYEIGKYYPDKGIYAGELKKQDGFYGIFAALQDAGEKDEDGDSQEYTWGEAMKIKFSQDNIHVPDIRELSLLHLNIDDVNAGLSAAGGEKLESDYWSSTEYDDDGAWLLRMSDGSRSIYTKYSNLIYVRPVLTIKL